MQALIVSILAQLAQVLAPLLWKWLGDEGQKLLAKNHISGAVEKSLAEYESVMEEQKVMAQDGLTEEEKNALREKKAKIRADIINAHA